MARILVTDDTIFMRTILKNVLTEGGHDIVAEAGHGREAVKMYQLFRPDLVTLDIFMPEMDGLQALKEIKRQHPHAKVIMCSAMGQQNIVVEAFRAGAGSFIVKPFQKAKVLEEVKRLLERKEGRGSRTGSFGDSSIFSRLQDCHF